MMRGRLPANAMTVRALQGLRAAGYDDGALAALLAVPVTRVDAALAGHVRMTQAARQRIEEETGQTVEQWALEQSAKLASPDKQRFVEDTRKLLGALAMSAGSRSSMKARKKRAAVG
jgi:plasmid maintenance system antidote protein VapI